MKTNIIGPARAIEQAFPLTGNALYVSFKRTEEELFNRNIHPFTLAIRAEPK